MNYSFDINHAKQYGVDEAIIIYNFQFWLMKNKANGNNLHDGRHWTYNSVRAYSELFPFWTQAKIKRILKSLVDQGVLVKGCYNKVKYDRTNWYAFQDESIFLPLAESDQWKSENQPIKETKPANQKDETSQPIPDINQIVNSDSKPVTITDDSFNTFWQLYDKKTSHNKCLAKWRKIKPELHETIFHHVREYVKSTPDKKFRKNPETYLNNSGWNDEIVYSKGTPKPVEQQQDDFKKLCEANKKYFD